MPSHLKLGKHKKKTYKINVNREKVNGCGVNWHIGTLASKSKKSHCQELPHLRELAGGHNVHNPIHIISDKFLKNSKNSHTLAFLKHSFLELFSNVFNKNFTKSYSANEPGKI
jgi:hypothetical protein